MAIPLEKQENKPMTSQEIIHKELFKQNLARCQVRVPHQAKTEKNEYLLVDDATFRERVNQNRMRFRERLKELKEANQVYLELLSFS